MLDATLTEDELAALEEQAETAGAMVVVAPRTIRRLATELRRLRDEVVPGLAAARLALAAARSRWARTYEEMNSFAASLYSDNGLRQVHGSERHDGVHHLFLLHPSDAYPDGLRWSLAAERTDEPVNTKAGDQMLALYRALTDCGNEIAETKRAVARLVAEAIGDGGCRG